MFKLPRLKKNTIKKIYKNLTRTKKQNYAIKKKRLKKLSAKREHKQWIIERFGKLRYYLSFWFGEWILYV
jgi:tRNA G18 (ribose-2'-O)-methylase SpoU